MSGEIDCGDNFRGNCAFLLVPEHAELHDNLGELIFPPFRHQKPKEGGRLDGELPSKDLLQNVRLLAGRNHRTLEHEHELTGRTENRPEAFHILSDGRQLRTRVGNPHQCRRIAPCNAR